MASPRAGDTLARTPGHNGTPTWVLRPTHDDQDGCFNDTPFRSNDGIADNRHCPDRGLRGLLRLDRRFGTERGRGCHAGKLTLSGHRIVRAFRFKSGKVARISLKLPGAVRAAVITAGRHKPHQLRGKLVITTTLAGTKVRNTRGILAIKS